MKSSLLMNFTVDKDNKKILVEREFAADVPMVWRAWTESELLDQWWAPKPWKAETKSMDFREGGFWQYAMVGPNNEKHWARADYKKINKQKFYTAEDAFCDENGNINNAFPRMDWNVQFDAVNDDTKVSINISFKQLSDLEQIIEMGFKEGFTMGLSNLDELLENNK